MKRKKKTVYPSGNDITIARKTRNYDRIPINYFNYLAKNPYIHPNDLKALISQQSTPSLRSLDDSLVLNIIYCHFPLVNFGSILDKEDNTALISDDYSVILIKQNNMIYAFKDDGNMGNPFFSPLQQHQNHQLWKNIYNIAFVIKLDMMMMMKEKGVLLDINNETTFDDILSLYHKGITIVNVMKITIIPLLYLGSPCDFFHIDSTGERLPFCLSFNYSREDHRKYENMILTKFIYISFIMREHGIPFDDIKRGFFCWKKRELWRFDDTIYQPPTSKEFILQAKLEYILDMACKQDVQNTLYY